MKNLSLIFSSNDTQNAGFCFKFFKIKSPQTGPMLLVLLSDGAMINFMKAAQLSIYS